MTTDQHDLNGPAYGAMHAHGQRCRYSALCDNNDVTGDRSFCTWSATCARCGTVIRWEQDLYDRDARVQVVSVQPGKRISR